MEEEAILKLSDLRKWFPTKKSLIESLFIRKEIFVKAVDGISFEVRKGEIFGLVGESGCGKTTAARLIAMLITPTSGNVYFEGLDTSSLSRHDLKKIRMKIQMMFQDPYASLSDRMKVYDIVAEPLKIHKLTDSVEERVMDALEDSGLKPPEAFLGQYPHELSGGERQRVSIARALVLRPTFLIADEPVSMIDASIKMGIINLILELKKEYALTCLYITHNVAMAWYICDRIAVMYLGKIVEMGPTDEIIHEPLHPYTGALMSVVPIPDPIRAREREKKILKGEIPSPINIPPGCRFHPRCPFVKDRCKKEVPKLIDFKDAHHVACHYPIQ